MTQAKYYDSASGTWKPIIAGPLGPQGNTGLAGIVSSDTAPGDTTVLWLDTAATAVGVDLDAWTAYTPTWGASVNPSIGNGTIVGRYKQIGKVVHFTIKLTAGSTTSFGAGTWVLYLPITAQSSTYQFVGNVLDSSTGDRYQAIGAGDIQGDTSYFSVLVNSTTASSPLITTGNPMSWASGDTLTISGTYEAA